MVESNWDRTAFDVPYVADDGGVDRLFVDKNVYGTMNVKVGSYLQADQFAELEFKTKSNIRSGLGIVLRMDPSDGTGYYVGMEKKAPSDQLLVIRTKGGSLLVPTYVLKAQFNIGPFVPNNIYKLTVRVQMTGPTQISGWLENVTAGTFVGVVFYNDATDEFDGTAPHQAIGIDRSRKDATTYENPILVNDFKAYIP